MNPLSILYIGANAGTSRHRALALQRLGHDIFIVDPFALLPRNRLAGLWAWKTGALFLEDFMRRRVLASIPNTGFDVVLIDGGDLVGPALVQELKRRFGAVASYNVDDPYGGRDGRRWNLYLQSVPFYDLVVVVRESNVTEAFAQGASRVLRVHRSADEVAHSPREISELDRQKWASEVLFVGTWMPARGPCLARLVELGVPLSIYGNRWSRAAEWPVLRQAWRGPGLEAEDDYSRAIQCAKVNLGLLSKQNRDLTTTRSFEIPHLGGVFCGERTSEHSDLYRENEDAVFWSSPEECATECVRLLGDGELRSRLAASGRRRCLQNGTTNEKVMAKIICEVLPDGLGLNHDHAERLMESTANTLPTAALLRHG
jgi:spore maturation protein CgeB